METTSPYLAQPNRGKNKIAVVIATIVIIALVIGAIVIFQKSKKTETKETTATQTEQPSPTPTEKPKIDKSTVKIQVQNGTGTPGQASSVVESLTKAGYSADNIKTANATDLNTSSTVISVKKGFEDTASDISDSLKSTFSDIKIDSSPLESSSDFDVVIITGGKTYQEVSPTKAKTITPTTAVSPSPSTSPAATTTTTPSPTPTP